MIISLMVMTNDGTLFAAQRDSFDEKQGYHRKDLRKLYLSVRRELAMKIKHMTDINEKDK